MSIPHPRLHDFFVGHEPQLALLKQAMASGRMHHAWLLTGDEGIGKATLAYRIIRALLANSGLAAPSITPAAPPIEPDIFTLFGAPEPAPMAASAPTTTIERHETLNLDIPATHPVSRRIANISHGDLLVLEAGESEKSGKKGDITVEMVREVGAFMALTPSESAWRIVLIDGAESMNPNAANALLKVLEEPPAHGLIFLVAHSSGRLLPTIRSRCRRLVFHQLSESQCAQAVQHFAPQTTPSDLHAAMTLAGTSVGQVLALLEQQGMKQYLATLSLLQHVSGSKDVIALAEQMAKADVAGWSWFVRGVNRLMMLAAAYASRPLSNENDPLYSLLAEEKAILPSLAARRPLDSWLSLWDNSNQWVRHTHQLNLDKRQTAFELLNALTTKETA